MPDFSGILSTVTDAITGLAGKISQSGVGGKIVDGLIPGIDDISYNIEKNNFSNLISDFKKLGVEFSDETLETLKGKINIDPSKLIDSINQSRADVQDSIISLTQSDEYKKYADVISKNLDSFQQSIDKYSSRGNNPLDLALDATKAYYGDETFGTKRKIAAGIGYAAPMLGIRFLTGGDLTHNARGENDIAGIPFF